MSKLFSDFSLTDYKQQPNKMRHSARASGERGEPSRIKASETEPGAARSPQRHHQCSEQRASPGPVLGARVLPLGSLLAPPAHLEDQLSG